MFSLFGRKRIMHWVLARINLSFIGSVSALMFVHYRKQQMVAAIVSIAVLEESQWWLAEVVSNNILHLITGDCCSQISSLGLSKGREGEEKITGICHITTRVAPGKFNHNVMAFYNLHYMFLKPITMEIKVRCQNISVTTTKKNLHFQHRSDE